MSSAFIAAAVQKEVDYEPIPKGGLLEELLHFVDEAARNQAKLIVLPESANNEWFFASMQEAKEVAETVEGEYVKALAERARKHNVFIASGFTEWDEKEDLCYNSTILVGPNEKLLLHYRKHFLIAYDKNWATPGNVGFPVVDTPIGKFGAFICADARLPEIARSTTLNGADILVNTSNWGGADQYKYHVPCRAIENGVWVVAANECGHDQPGKNNVGHSMIVSPDGTVVAEATDDRPGIIYGEIDLTKRTKVLERRRPELYRVLLQPSQELPVGDSVNEKVVPENYTAVITSVQIPSSDTAEDVIKDFEDYVSYSVVRNFADIIVLPELFAFNKSQLSGGGNLEEYYRTSKRVLEKGIELSKKHNLYLVLNLLEKAQHDKASIVAYLIHPDGHFDTYRKTHLSSKEQQWAESGNDLPVFDTKFGKMGLVIGEEGLIPEVIRVLTLKGADIVCWPTSWKSEQDYRIIAHERVMENRIVLATSNRLDSEWQGPSAILQGLSSSDISGCSAWESKVGTADMITALVNTMNSRVKRIYKNTDVVFGRRPEYYQPLVEKGLKNIGV